MGNLACVIVNKDMKKWLFDKNKKLACVDENIYTKINKFELWLLYYSSRLKNLKLKT